MMLALCVLGLSRVVKLEPTPREILITAVILTAALYTKQTAALFVAWACAFAFVRNPRAGLSLGFTTFGLSLLLLISHRVPPAKSGKQRAFRRMVALLSGPSRAWPSGVRVVPGLPECRGPAAIFRRSPV